MRVLIACEESQAVCKAFRERGHEAFSSDIKPPSGGKPEWHIQGDVLGILNEGWDLMIAHPPCTYLTTTGARWLYNKDGSKNEQRWKDREEALVFVNCLLNAPIPKIALENPVGAISSEIKKPSQIIQPFWFGDSASKKTCLWLKNLPNLAPTSLVDVEYVTTSSGKRFSKWYWETSRLKGEARRAARSKTFQGIANAMADQWGSL